MTSTAPMRGREFLAFAEQTSGLTGQAPSRSRISRYYYAAYLEYREHFVIAGYLTRSRMAREHQVVKTLVATHFPDVASMMEALRTNRNLADYELDIDLATIRLMEEESRTSTVALLERIDAMPA
jgi:hypothetical protein